MVMAYCAKPDLTYMSIQDEINKHLGVSLFFLAPLIRSQRAIRELFVSREVWDAVTLPFGSNRDGNERAKFRAYLDAYTSGEEIGVSERPFSKRADTFMARVHPIEHHVWDIRVIEPRPGIRCFGCFGDIDLFVALTWDYRDNLDETPAGFELKAKECRRIWLSLFTSPPFNGGIDDLFSFNFNAN